MDRLKAEAKIEQLLRELETISPPFLHSRDVLKRIGAELHLFADMLEAEILEEQAENLPEIPQHRPLFADHSNPVPPITEEEIEAELIAPAVVVPISDLPLTPPKPRPQDEYQADVPGADMTVPAEIPLPEPEETLSPQPEPLAPPLTQTQLPLDVAEPMLESPTVVLPPEPEPVPEPEPILPPTPPTAPEPIHIEEPVVIQTPNPAAIDLQRSLPLVKRLEFINRLFGGQDAEWQLFCQQVNRAPSTSEALQVYRETYIRLSWEKQPDMADLLKQLIVKVFG
jgi:hypothetical protein